AAVAYVQGTNVEGTPKTAVLRACFKNELLVLLPFERCGHLVNGRGEPQQYAYPPHTHNRNPFLLHSRLGEGFWPVRGPPRCSQARPRRILPANVFECVGTW
ncbi:unnamed protein product, partial [Ectocarpus sp. 12 AP-2014]